MSSLITRIAMFIKASNYSISLLSGMDIEYDLLGTKSKQQIPKMSFPLTPSKKYIIIKEFKDEIKDLKNILNENKKLESLREKEIKRKLNMLDDEINNILETLDLDLTTLELKCKFLEKPLDFEEETELRLSAKNKE